MSSGASSPLRILADGVPIGPQSKGVGLYTVAIIEQILRLDSSTEFIVPVTFDPTTSSQLDLPGVTRLQVSWKNHFWHGFRSVPELTRKYDPSIVWWPYETSASTPGPPFAMSCHDIPGEIRRAQQTGGGTAFPVAPRHPFINDMLNSTRELSAGRYAVPGSSSATAPTSAPGSPPISQSLASASSLPHARRPSTTLRSPSLSS